MFNQMQRDLEERIEKYFPANLKKNNKVFFLGKPRFVLDYKAVNENINGPIRDFLLRGGKRLRPLLFLTSLELFDKNYKKFLGFAVFIELIHNGTLVLDDIEDDGELRRGQLASHKKFGLDTATNVGFSLHVLPLKILLSKQKGLTNNQRTRIWQIYSEELINLSYGQGLDIYWHKNSSSNVSVDKYLEMARLKTGSLMRMSLRLACVLGGKNEKVEKLFREFGESLGMAFQIRDDTLDLISNSKFGKSFGNDITEGKMSLPIIFTLKSTGKREKQRLIEILGKHSRNKRLLSEAIRTISESGSINKSLIFAEEMIDKAWRKLTIGFPDVEKFEEFKELAYLLIKRKY